jgi:hypothetical protein
LTRTTPGVKGRIIFGDDQYPRKTGADFTRIDLLMTHAPACGETVFLGDFGAALGADAYSVAGEGFPPYKAVDAGGTSVSAAEGIAASWSIAVFKTYDAARTNRNAHMI